MNAHVDPARMSHDQLLAYCYDLEAKVEANRENDEAQGLARVRRHFHLTGTEAEMLVLFSDGKMHRKEHILTALYSTSAGDEPELKIIDVFVCKLRKKLDGSGIVVETVWGQGYWLRDTAALKAIMAGEQPETADAPALDLKRPAGSKPRPHGSTRDAALDWLRRKAIGNPVIEFFPSELSRAIDTLTSGASIVRYLEKSGYVEVLFASPRRGGAKWRVKLTEKGLSRAPER